MKNLTLVMAIICMATLIGGCSSINVSHEFDPGTDFAVLKTFSWMEVTDVGPQYGMKQVLGDRVENSVDKQLQAKGMTKVEDNADVLLIYHVTKEMRINTEDWGYKYDPNWGKGDNVKTYDHAVGILIVDMLDADSLELLWRGTGDKILPEDITDEKRTELVDNVIAKIFEDFPPKK